MLKHPLVNLLRANAGRGQKLRTDPANAAGEATMWFYDAVGVDPWSGGGIDPLEVAQALASLNGAAVRLRIHSPGGDAFDGRAIATAIAAYGGPTVAQIDGLAASAASYVALAADRVEMGPGSFFMIHEGWTMALGNKGDMLQVAAMLETFDNSLIADYARQTGNTPAQIQAWLEAETWFEAADAVKAGFADGVLGDPDGNDDENLDNLLARYDLSAYARAPKALRRPPAAAAAAPAPAVPAFDPAGHGARLRRAASLVRSI